MKQNIFLTSVLRQTARSFVLFLLIGAAAFSFVLRTTEYMVVRDRIFEIADFYRSIGFLQVDGQAYGNVLEGAEIISQSGMIGFEDRRRGAEAVMHGMLNADIGGIMDTTVSASFFNPDDGLYVDNHGYIDTWGRWAQRHPDRYHYAFFYGTLEGIVSRRNEHAELVLRVDNVKVGFPQHVVEGQILHVQYFFKNGDPTVDMEVGQRYLLRAAYHGVSHERGWRSILPVTGRLHEFLLMSRLFDGGPLYANVPYGEVDFNMPGLEGLAEEVERMRYNHSVLWLRTTTDMSTIPTFQPQFGTAFLQEGRLINREDYLEARPVAVIHHHLALFRGLEIGDTITVSIPREQSIAGLHEIYYLYTPGMGSLLVGDTSRDFIVKGSPEEFMVEELELEIVGIHIKMPTSENRDWFWGVRQGIIANSFANHVYIPDSLLPSDFMPVDDLYGNSEYIWDVWYSFVLGDTRDEAAFILEYRDEMAALGLNLVMIPSGAENFWLSATPILQSITFNAVMFWIVLIIVLGLVTFLYLHQRHKDFAVMRALGSPRKDTVRQICAPMVLFGLPAIFAGGVLGWAVALGEAANTLNLLTEAIEGYESAYEAAGEFSIMWLALQIGVVFAIMLCMAFAGAVRTAKLPVLELLQGRRVKVGGQSIAQMRPITVRSNAFDEGGADASHLPRNDNAETLGKSPVKAYNINISSLQFILKHIFRAPIKSALTVGVALFFITALGMLGGAIADFEREIDRLYDTTVVMGEAVQSDTLFPILDPMYNIILRYTADTLVEHGLIQKYYAEAGFAWSFVIPADEDGNFPQGVYGEFWDEFQEYLREEYNNTESRLDPLFAFNDIEAFLAEHSTQFEHGIPGIIAPEGLYFGEDFVVDPIEIQFAPGFGWDDYVYYDDTLQAPIPVILPERTLERSGLDLGDSAFIVQTNHRLQGASEIPIIVIGSHNGGIALRFAQDAVLIPFFSMEQLLGDQLRYITFRFEVYTGLNRDILAVREEIQTLVRNVYQRNRVGLRAIVEDEGLRVVVGQMEQNLSLLRMLYPVVIAISVVIGSGLAVLLMLQNAKNAAIMRVLGYEKTRARAMMCIEHIFVAVLGIMIGMILLPFFGIYFELELPLLAFLYLLGAMAGSVAGAVIITSRAPLDLLQVRE